LNPVQTKHKQKPHVS